MYTSEKNATSIMPHYDPVKGVGSSVLPRYTAIGDERTGTTDVTRFEKNEDGTITETTTFSDGTEEQKTVVDPNQKTASASPMLSAGVLFFVGLALGYIWGGTTGNISR